MYCRFCGAEVDDDAIYCSKCGARISSQTHEQNYSSGSLSSESGDSVCGTIAFVLMVCSCVVFGCSIIPLLWMIPMTVSYWNHLKRHEPTSAGFKVCVLIFVNFIAGILLLVDEKA